MPILLFSIDRKLKCVIGKKVYKNLKLFKWNLLIVKRKNYGIAFNKLENRFKLIIGLNIGYLAYLIYFYVDNINYREGVILIMTGGLGNFLDRLKRGYVIDYIKIKNLPVFNLSDLYMYWCFIFYIWRSKMELRFLNGYQNDLIVKVRKIIREDRLGDIIIARYPSIHEIKTDKLLYSYTMEIKKRHIKNSQALFKVRYDNKIEFTNQALGLHTFRPVKQGKKIKMKNEIRISSTFKNVPEKFLRNIVIHELAHLKEKQHNKSFYNLCLHMEQDYAQIEFDLRLFLTYQELYGDKLWK